MPPVSSVLWLFTARRAVIRHAARRYSAFGFSASGFAGSRFATCRMPVGLLRVALGRVARVPVCLVPVCLVLAGPVEAVTLATESSSMSTQALVVPLLLSGLAAPERATVCVNTMQGFARSAVRDMSAGELWDRSSRRYRMSEGLLAVAAALRPASQALAPERREQLAALAEEVLSTPRQDVVDYCADVGVALFESLTPAEQANRRHEARAAFAELVAE